MSRSLTSTRTWGGLIGIVMGLVALAFVLIGLAIVWMEHQTLAKRIQEQSDRYKRLEEAVQELPTALAERNLNERIVHDVLSQCRIVDDIPDLKGDHIVSILRSTDGFKVFLYVPKGKHTLEITLTWHLDVEKPDVQAASTERASWNVPLIGASGYVLRVEPDVDESFGWELVSNHPDFTAERVEIPLESFSPSGWSWGPDRVFSFPNEEWRRGRPGVETQASGVTIMDSALRGPVGGKPYVMRIKVRVCTDGPRAMSARGAMGLVGKNRDQLEPYAGGGKYLLRD